MGSLLPLTAHPPCPKAVGPDAREGFCVGRRGAPRLNSVAQTSQSELFACWQVVGWGGGVGGGKLRSSSGEPRSLCCPHRADDLGLGFLIVEWTKGRSDGPSQAYLQDRSSVGDG